jgi:hypothetical protein
LKPPAKLPFAVRQSKIVLADKLKNPQVAIETEQKIDQAAFP